jgi:hypothetical protein
MLSASVKQRVVRATVRIIRSGARGVLVPGGYILTAAHCIDWDGRGGMVLGDHFFEPVETRDGASFLTQPQAVELMSDIAALGQPDNQTVPEDWEAFLDFENGTAPVPLAAPALEVDQPLPVHVLNRNGKWIRATVTLHAPRELFRSGTIVLNAGKPIVGGDSGSPIVDDAGLLVGVVSHTNEVDSGPCRGMIPLASLALPRWLIEHSLAAALQPAYRHPDQPRRQRLHPVTSPRAGRFYLRYARWSIARVLQPFTTAEWDAT